MILENIIPWGRNLSEYIAMFLLTKGDLSAKILGCGDGPSSFNTEVDLDGGSVVSIDPLYAYSKKEIMNRINEVSDTIMEQVNANKESFVWKTIENPTMLLDMRIEAMTEFIIDYNEGREEGRYVNESLPALSFDDKQFDLALSSHFLFLYSEHLDMEFHLQSILEMLRVANEVRIFPLVDLKNEKSPYINEIMEKLTESGYDVSIVETGYEFKKGANEMMQVIHR